VTADFYRVPSGLLCASCWRENNAPDGELLELDERSPDDLQTACSFCAVTAHEVIATKASVQAKRQRPPRHYD
jgi:hypothetical protein